MNTKEVINNFFAGRTEDSLVSANGTFSLQKDKWYFFLFDGDSRSRDSLDSVFECTVPLPTPKKILWTKSEAI